MKWIVNKRGSAQIGLCYMLLFVMLFIGLWLAIFPVVLAKMQLENYCTELVRVAEIEGVIDSAVVDRQNELSDRIVPSQVDFTGTQYMSGSSKKIQLNDRIVVNATYDYKFEYFVFNWTFHLKAKADGSSEMYWKD